MGTAIGDLPAEVLLHVVSFLTVPADLVRAEAVSHHWRHLIRNSDYTWRTLFLFSFGGSEGTSPVPPPPNITVLAWPNPCLRCRERGHMA